MLKKQYGGRRTTMRKFRKLNQLQRNIECVKVKVRPHLRKETKYQFTQQREKLVSRVEELRAASNSKNVRRICQKDISVDEFRRFFEKTNSPVILSEPYWKRNNSVSQSSPALVRLTRFLKLFRDEYLECGEDGDGYSIEIKLKNFLIYTRRFNDRFPLYIFDGSVPHWRDAQRKRIMVKNLFDPPKFFKQDYMAYLGRGHRPPWKWLLIGPKNSGTALHVDPLGTSAWNSLLFGEKIWLLFPPETPAELLQSTQSVSYCKEACDWIISMYPRTQCNSWPQEYKPLLAFQFPGDVMFVPSGWWHLVLNVKTSVAVTQNFVSQENFPLVWEKTSKEKPDLAEMWSKALLKHGQTHVTAFQSGFHFN